MELRELDLKLVPDQSEKEVLLKLPEVVLNSMELLSTPALKLISYNSTSVLEEFNHLTVPKPLL